MLVSVPHTRLKTRGAQRLSGCGSRALNQFFRPSAEIVLLFMFVLILFSYQLRFKHFWGLSVKSAI